MHGKFGKCLAWFIQGCFCFKQQAGLDDCLRTIPALYFSGSDRVEWLLICRSKFFSNPSMYNLRMRTSVCCSWSRFRWPYLKPPKPRLEAEHAEVCCCQKRHNQPKLRNLGLGERDYPIRGRKGWVAKMVWSGSGSLEQHSSRTGATVRLSQPQRCTSNMFRHLLDWITLSKIRVTFSFSMLIHLLRQTNLDQAHHFLANLNPSNTCVSGQLDRSNWLVQSKCDTWAYSKSWELMSQPCRGSLVPQTLYSGDAISLKVHRQDLGWLTHSREVGEEYSILLWRPSPLPMPSLPSLLGAMLMVSWGDHSYP